MVSFISQLSLHSYQTEAHTVIIVGHSGCGGATACLSAVQSESYSTYGSAQTLPQYPASHALNRWLAPLTELIESLDVASKPVASTLPIVVDANVKRQVENLSKTAAVKRARDEGKEVWIHGWVYDLATGNLRDLEVSRSADAAD
jgi:carbonic anhydrase